MLWNTLIIKAITWIDANPHHPGSQFIQLEAKANHLPWPTYVRSMPPTRASALRALIPEAFPRPLRNTQRQLQLTENIHGKWRVDLQAK